MTKEEDVVIDDEYLDAELKSLLDVSPEGKKLFYRFSKKWRDLLNSLGKEDRSILLKMILEVCSYNENIISMINMENSESYTDLLFFLLTMMMQQKRIDDLSASGKKKRNVTLLDFMPK